MPHQARKNFIISKKIENEGNNLRHQKLQRVIRDNGFKIKATLCATRVHVNIKTKFKKSNAVDQI